MKRDDEQRLHDYLDGRLSEEERAKLEARVAREPELRQRLETYREIGLALRSDPVELPPGFFTRARARFEATTRRRPPLRLLSWETAGVAAAAMLILALFLPGLLEDEMPGEELADRPAFESSRPAAASGPEPTEQEREPETTALGRVGSEAPLPSVLPAAADARKPAAPPARDRNEMDRGEDRLDVAASPLPGKARESFDEEERAEPPAAVAKRRLASARAEQAPLAQFAPVPPPAGTDDAEGRSRGYYRARGGAAEPLPPGLVQAGRLQVIETDEELRELNAARAARRLPPFLPDPEQRLVLVGPRERPLDCSALVVATSRRSYTVIVPAGTAGAGEAAGGGCAIWVPRDDRPVTLVDEGRSDE